MKRIGLLVAVALVGCGGGDDDGTGGTGGTGPTCYAYDFGTYCADFPDDPFAHFCWWTGRQTTDRYPCSDDAMEQGCKTVETGHVSYTCALFACRPENVDNDPCCTDAPVRYYEDGSTGSWDSERVAFCI